VILTNELPRLSDSSGALASRFVLLVLTKSFLGREDPALTDKLMTESSGIFNWALEGLDQLNSRGYFELPKSSKESILQLQDLSSPVSAFVRDWCRRGASESVLVDDLWKAWKEWCEDENRQPATKAVFGRNLRSAVPTIHKTRIREDGEDRSHRYGGIGLAVKTMRGRRDHYDQGDGSQQRSGDVHSTGSQQNPSKDAPGHSGHSKDDVYEQNGAEEDVMDEDLRPESPSLFEGLAE
jgi:putative DNA primase/helicase